MSGVNSKGGVVNSQCSHSRSLVANGLHCSPDTRAQRWTLVLIGIGVDNPGALQHAIKRRALYRRRRIYSAVILSFLTFSLTFPVSRPVVEWGVSIYLPTLSLFPLSFFPSCLRSITSARSLSLSLSLSLPLPHTHTTHILFPITDVPFHQMKTKAKLWAFSATWDPFNLRQHEGKWGQICQAQLTLPPRS